MRLTMIILLSLLLTACDQPPPERQSFKVAEALGGGSDEGFARAFEPRQFRFPEDHAPHPAFRNEWWYLTGRLQTEDGRAFGYQATLFRISLQAQAIEGFSTWRSNHIWMGHAALSDVEESRHLAFERIARPGAGLAGAIIKPLRIWLEDWQLQQADESGSWSLRLPTEEFELNLKLDPASPIVLQGEQGLSQKSPEPGNASYYYSIPRLSTEGSLSYRGKQLRVSGESWFDREWSTSALGPEQQGWDWFSLHLRDGRNLMYYQLRRKDGSTDPMSAGSLSDASGKLRTMQADSVNLTPLNLWRSGERRYPIEWRMQLEGEPNAWRIKARFPNQEMRLSVRYWEGAIEVIDEPSGDTIGSGYLEMTGYENH